MICYFGTYEDLNAEIGFEVRDEPVAAFYAVEFCEQIGGVVAFEGFDAKIDVCEEAYSEVIYL